MRALRLLMLTLLAVAALFSQSRKPVVREEISVNGETWRLEWKSKPASVCGPEEMGFYTCPCSGLAFGEAGKLDLVRLRGNKEIERLSLTHLFSDDSPGEGLATIQRYAVEPDDWEKEGTPELSRMVAQRKVVSVMGLADYNHDGKATEFFVQTGAGPCGHVPGVVVGTTKTDPRLHAFGTVRNPKKPLVLLHREWEEFRDSVGAIETVEFACGDHGSEEETAHHLTPTPAGIQVSERKYQCTEIGREKLLTEVEQ